MVLIDQRVSSLEITQIAQKSLKVQRIFYLPDAPVLQRLVSSDCQRNEAFDFSDVPVLFIFVRSLLSLFFFDHEPSQFHLSFLQNHQRHEKNVGLIHLFHFSKYEKNHQMLQRFPLASDKLQGAF